MRRMSRSKLPLTTSQLLLWAILMVGALLRFQNLGAIEHNIDHVYPIHQARLTIDRGVFPVTGQVTSVLFANPPLMGYLLILPVALTRSPVGAYIVIITLNTSAIWFVFSAAKRLLDERRALIAA